MISRCWKWTLGLVIAVNVLLTTGCRRDESSAPGSGTGEVRRRYPRDPGLQEVLDRLEAMPFESSPSRRPRVLSVAHTNRVEWFRRLLIEGHVAGGFADGPGSAEARVVLEAYAEQRFARVQPFSDDPELHAMAVRAREAGTRDPFVRFVELEEQPVAKTRETALALAVAMAETCHGMFLSSHHPYPRHLVAARTAVVARLANQASRRAGVQILATQALEDMFRDTNAPPSVLFGRLEAWTGHDKTSEWIDWVMSDLTALIEESWTHTADHHGLLAELAIDRGWQVRGGGYADTVSDEARTGFARHLAEAERHLETAWRVDPTNRKFPLTGLRLELGQGRGKAVARAWFDRAMALDPDHYDACVSMALYLEPKWYGSEEECLRFARECVRSEPWGGRVPLVLVTVHGKLANWRKQRDDDAYWGRPQVWADLQEAYEKFFRLNPDAHTWRAKYAADAFRCGRHGVFLEQVERFGAHTNWNYFGGVEAFEGMLAKARAEVGGGR